VSRQIQALEARLGVALFRRMHRALALTEHGRVFQQATIEALEALQRATHELKGAAAAKNVVVATTPGFAGLWLIPRLASFVSLNPGIDVRISAGNALTNLEREGVDVAVRYQPVDARPASAVALFGETVFPVCSPGLRLRAKATLATPADLRHHTLLRMESDGKNQLQDWGLWLHAVHLADLKPAGLLHFSSYDQLVQAAVAGQGIALGRMPLIDRLLKDKKLVAPFANAVVSPRGYCMLTAPSASHRAEVLAFTAWLASTARGPGSAPRRGRGQP